MGRKGFIIMTMLVVVFIVGCRAETSIPMVYVKGGTFLMGDTAGGGRSEEKPIHSVKISSFYIGTYEITQEAWEAIMGSNPSRFVWDPDIDELQALRPVERVSWYDTLVFCNKLSMLDGFTPCYKINQTTNTEKWGEIPNGKDTTWDAVICDWNADGYRLPTEAEWEYAAKGGNKKNNTTYAGSNIADDVAWYFTSETNYKTHEVGMKFPNSLGIYDMSGNISEWCWDWDGDYSNQNQTNPRGISTGEYRVLRGGSWASDKISIRISGRGSTKPHIRYYDSYDLSFSLYGVRVVRKAD